MKNIFLIIFVSFLLLSCGGSSSDNKTKIEKKEELLSLSDDQIEALIDLELQGYIDIQPENIRVYVDPSLWNGLDFKLKEDLSLSFAIWVANKRGKNLYWVDIYDKMSGKKLAKYSKSWGFKVY